jgi:hypothetical protein
MPIGIGCAGNCEKELVTDAGVEVNTCVPSDGAFVPASVKPIPAASTSGAPANVAWKTFTDRLVCTGGRDEELEIVTGEETETVVGVICACALLLIATRPKASVSDGLGIVP